LKDLSPRALSKRMEKITSGDIVEAIQGFNNLIDTYNRILSNGDNTVIMALREFFRKKPERLQLGLIRFFKEKFPHLQKAEYIFCDYLVEIAKRLSSEIRFTTIDCHEFRIRDVKINPRKKAAVLVPKSQRGNNYK
jgi:hypothetical protein